MSSTINPRVPASAFWTIKMLWGIRRGVWKKWEAAALNHRHAHNYTFYFFLDKLQRKGERWCRGRRAFSRRVQPRRQRENHWFVLGLVQGEENFWENTNVNKQLHLAKADINAHKISKFTNINWKKWAKLQQNFEITWWYSRKLSKKQNKVPETETATPF